MGPLAAVAAVLALAGGAPASGDFSARVSNPYYPLQPGMRWEYRGVKDGRPLRDVVTVTSRIERIGGVPGQTFAQERHAEDHFKILSRDATIAVPFGTFTRRALMTGEWTPLEPGVRDRKWYVRGIGEVKELTVKGGDERAELVSFHGP
jgi:hypothetical protein